jgi:hypothetical protein
MTVAGSRFRCVLVLLAAAAAAAEWTDRGEYDLALTIRAEAAPKTRLQLLDQWKAKYPKSAMSQVRRELYLSTYQSLGDSAGMLAVAKEMVSEQPSSPVGLYWCVVLIPGGSDVSEDTLQIGERAGRALLSGLDTHFNTSRRPPSVPESEWRKQRGDAELLARRALGWIRWQRGDYPGAQEEFTAALRQEAANAELSAWLGIVLALEKQPEKQVPALWHLARAAALRGEGALAERQRRQIGNLLERLYTAYHGDTSGLDQLRARAEGDAFPPADFSIEPAAVVAARRQQEELERTNPMLAAWLRIRSRLEAPDGREYFVDTLAPAPLPRLKGSLIRCSASRKAEEIVLGMRDPAVEEVVLRLSSPLASCAEPGVQLEFEGRAESFSQNPFLLTVAVERDKLDGWPSSTSPTRRQP